MSHTLSNPSSRLLAAALAAQLLVTGPFAAAQEPMEPEGTVFLISNGVPAMPLNVPAFGAVSVVGSDAGPVVEGKPYAADAVTTTTQQLADGNRIVHRNAMRVYRDSAGRTRREQQLTAPGFAPYPPPGGSMITINDPAAGTSFMLDPNTETARRLPSFDVATTLVAAGTRMDRAPGLADAPPPGAPPELEAAPEHTGIQRTVEPGAFNVVVERFATQLPQPMPAGPARTAFFRAAPAVLGELDTRTEELGEQVLQGVRARGTRVMRTIPAGAIGNERAIEIVSETWYSPELEVDILRRHLDPRTGETVYELVSIDRSEPPADLFAVPSGYEIRNGPGAIDFELHREFEAPSAE